MLHSVCNSSAYLLLTSSDLAEAYALARKLLALVATQTPGPTLHGW
jgi:hypothetical protein